MFILGDPGAVSRVDKLFVVKVFCKIGAIKAFNKGVLYHGEDCNRGPINDPPILEPAFLLVNR